MNNLTTPLIKISNIIDDRVDNLVRTAIDEFHKQGVSTVILSLSCIRGGFHAPVFRMLNHMKSSGIRFDTFASNFIMSAGIYIYAAGEKRLADENAYFRFHRPGCMSNGIYVVASSNDEILEKASSGITDFERLKRLRDDMKIMNDQVLCLLESQINCPREYLEIMLEGEIKLSLNEALETGLVHGILHPVTA